MAEEKKQPKIEAASTEEKKTVNGAVSSDKPKFSNDRRGGGARRPGRRDKRDSEKKDEFDQKILDIARVTRVMAGGKRMRFRACVAIGDKKGKIAVGIGKGADVTLAVNKAVNQAKKAMIDVSIVNDTIPHQVYNKFGAAKILFKPAKAGRGVIAGGVVRLILELAGVKNITCKILGTSNKVSNSKCTIEALKQLKRVDVKKPEVKENKTAVKDVKKEDKKEEKEIKEEKNKK